MVQVTTVPWLQLMQALTQSSSLREAGRAGQASTVPVTSAAGRWSTNAIAAATAAAAIPKMMLPNRKPPRDRRAALRRPKPFDPNLGGADATARLPAKEENRRP